MSRSVLFLVVMAAVGCSRLDEDGGQGTGGKADDPTSDAGMECLAELTAPPVGDVEEAWVDLGAWQAPCDYPYGQASVPGYSLGGPEFWIYGAAELARLEAIGQSLSYGRAHFSYENATPAAKRCVVAAQQRFADIMADAPASVAQLDEATDWSGSFFNWTNDYTGATNGSASFRGLWMYNGSLVKWVSETRSDGTCYLPTRAKLDAFAEACRSSYPSCRGESYPND